jgi:hypothetical protein
MQNTERWVIIGRYKNNSRVPLFGYEAKQKDPHILRVLSIGDEFR